jgi:type IV pilus assembly protein PilE
MCRESFLNQGFSLVELLFVLVLLSILAGIAWPSLEGPILRSRRMEGMEGLVHVWRAQARFRSQSGRYGSQAELEAAGLWPSDFSPHYRFDVFEDQDGVWVAQAEAQGWQARDRANGRSCARLALSVPSPRIREPAECWPR